MFACLATKTLPNQWPILFRARMDASRASVYSRIREFSREEAKANTTKGRAGGTKSALARGSEGPDDRNFSSDAAAVSALTKAAADVPTPERRPPAR